MKSSTQADLHPKVLHPIELATFIQQILNRPKNPINLIICSSQDEFLVQLVASMAHDKEVEKGQAEAAGFQTASIEHMFSRPHNLLIPTIHQLSKSSDVKVTFCETVPQLQASLAVYAGNEDTGGSNQPTTMAMINPVSLHRDTSAFSAQGLSRTFASAIEAAVKANQKLLIVECPSRVGSEQQGHDNDDDPMLLDDSNDVRAEGDVNTVHDLWEEQISILNVTTKSFGAGEKGWVGRTVKVRRVVERWCTFEKPRR